VVSTINGEKPEVWTSCDLQKKYGSAQWICELAVYTLVDIGRFIYSS
jgi:hypothetical protein